MRTSTAEPTKPLRTRAIQDEDVEFIAKQVARGLTEVHAVELLGKFNYRKWVHYKEKPLHGRKVADLISRMKACRMNNLLTQIETAGDVNQALKAGVRFDWRAAQFAGSLNYDSWRSNPSQQTTTNQTAIIIGAGGEQAVLKMLDQIYSQARVTASPEPKQLECPGDGQIDVNAPLCEDRA